MHLCTITSPQFLVVLLLFLIYFILHISFLPTNCVYIKPMYMWIRKFIRPKWNNLIIIISGWKNKCNPIFHCGWFVCSSHHQFRFRSTFLFLCSVHLCCGYCCAVSHLGYNARQSEHTHTHISNMERMRNWCSRIDWTRNTKGKWIKKNAHTLVATVPWLIQHTHNLIT